MSDTGIFPSTVTRMMRILENNRPFRMHPSVALVALDVVVILAGFSAFICVLAAFSGNYIDDENVFHAVVMFCTFFLKSTSSILDVCGVWHFWLDSKTIHVMNVVECFTGTFFALISSSVATGFYVKRWEIPCELQRGRGNFQKCDCLVASIVLGFLAATVLFLKGYICFKRARSADSDCNAASILFSDK
ncbi:uncharacterized protein LOC129594479 [Paramacrobiotus metropolitanus]|uniref:uncharacterized protein LOC129594479 n=1 Tax=Paramacrobiotus metropolitanus TaxID=2943436 RepID=UPI0024463DBE|nr:uncharacterized protein LOC129594479 [Paramacrobiotus metropolitanus]